MYASLALLTLALWGCDDTEFHGAEPSGSVDCDASADWCGVQQVFEAHCIACHSAGGAAGGLDLETDAWGAIVRADSAGSPGEQLVAPGDPEGSLLFRKLRGSQAEDEGGIMPPGSQGLSVREQALIWEWIAAGATQSCEGEADTGQDSGASR
jgi:mono/diheme cytochrome c family protein